MTCVSLFYFCGGFQSCSSAFLLRLVGSVHLHVLKHVLYSETEEIFFSEKKFLTLGCLEGPKEQKGMDCFVPISWKVKVGITKALSSSIPIW